MSVSWAPGPFTIHVNGDPSSLAEVAAAEGARVLRWKLPNVVGQRVLDASAAAAFQFPFESTSLAGLVDMLSDLEWLDVERGVLMLIDATEAPRSTVADVAGILPYIADRWRSGAVAFEVFLVGVADSAEVAAVLEKSNVELDEAGRVPWSRHDIARVPVVIHS
jgi:hypothetical protein